MDLKQTHYLTNIKTQFLTFFCYANWYYMAPDAGTNAPFFGTSKLKRI